MCRRKVGGAREAEFGRARGSNSVAVVGAGIAEANERPAVPRRHDRRSAVDTCTAQGRGRGGADPHRRRPEVAHTREVCVLRPCLRRSRADGDGDRRRDEERRRAYAPAYA